MNPRNTIKEELKGLDSGLDGEKYLPFSVPPGYFESLPDLVLARIRTADAEASAEIAAVSPLLAGISRQTPYSVPDGYFAENLEILPAFTGTENSPVLEMAGKAMPYAVPEGYFDTLQPAVKKPARVVTMRTQWMRTAVAAVFAGLVTISGLWFINNQNTQPITVAKQLKNVSTQELDAFIYTWSDEADASSAIQQPAPEVKNLLKDINDQELDAFLSQVPLEEDLFLN